jgi:hypothetical protein
MFPVASVLFQEIFQLYNQAIFFNSESVESFSNECLHSAGGFYSVMAIPFNCFELSLYLGNWEMAKCCAEWRQGMIRDLVH